MRRSRVRLGWLGWVVAGVLAVTAGGAALAASGQDAVQGDTATVSDGLAVAPAAFAPARKARLLQRLTHRRRALHGEVTVKTDNGIKTVVFARGKSEEHTSELQSRENLVCRLLLEKKKKIVK